MTSSMKITGFGGICLMIICLTILQLALAEKHCGSGLVDTLALMCTFGLSGYRMKRGSDISDDDSSIINDDDDIFPLSLDTLPFLSRKGGNSFSKMRIRRHAITHDCCERACSTDEMMRYCRTTPHEQL